MRITFLGAANFKMASYRYRILMPAKELMALGVDCSVMTSYDGLNSDIFVFSKHFSPDKDQAAVKKIKSPGFMAANQIAIVADDRLDPKIVFDVCDDHFDSDKFGSHYRYMCKEADLIIASTDRMAEIIKAKTGRESVVIPDPYEFPERKFRYKWPQWNPEKALWFGHGSNFTQLHRVWDDLKGWMLMIITDGIELTDLTQAKPFPTIKWNHENMMDGFSQSDVVVLPNAGMECHKGANRMLESIRQGVFVVAEPHPEYNKFKEWMYIGDIGKGLKWIHSNKEDIQPRMEKAQKFVSDNFHPQTIGKMWKNALDSIWDQEHKTGQDGSTLMASQAEEQTSQILPTT